MIAKLANILKEILINIDNGLDSEGQAKPKGLLFVDKIAGLAVVGEKSQPIDIPGAFAVSKFPISLDTEYEDCIRSGCYKDLVPNSKSKGIIYFEDFGTRIDPNRRGFNYISNLRLVCWVNNNLIQGNNCKSISHILITLIRKELESKGVFNSGVYQKIFVKASNIIENDIKLFSRYTYPSDSVKFLMHPYEAFGIDFTITYTINQNCINELEIIQDLC